MVVFGAIVKKPQIPFLEASPFMPEQFDLSDPVERTRQAIYGRRLEPIERAKQVARGAVNERWDKVSPGSPPVALHYFTVEEIPGGKLVNPKSKRRTS